MAWCDPGVFTWLFPATVTMTTGTVFLMWLGEQITERGVGNGISMLILVTSSPRCRARWQHVSRSTAR